MPVREIVNKQRIEPGHMYVLPPDFDVTIEKRRVLRLTRRLAGKHLHLPIDHFFESLARVEGEKAIGIVLSGTGSDGTAGLAAIKAAGGKTFAEAEASAKYFGMPGSAIASGCVDAVLTPGDLARELGLLADRTQGKSEPPQAPQAPKPKIPAEPLEGFQRIFELLKEHSSVDFSRYKDSTLRRRISRRMMLQQIDRTAQYTRFITSNPAELEALFNDLLINVTGFFRDPSTFEALKRKILPKILKKKGEEIRVWVPGCATGEEVYSLAICLMETVGRGAGKVKVRLFGTDLSDIAIAKARAGVYPESISKRVSPARLRRFFTKTGAGYQVHRMIREMCTFARQNLFQDPPFSRVDLISCRNVLIYLGPALQNKCIPIFHYALVPGGYLMLGPSETIGSFSDLFTPVDKGSKIYASNPALQRTDAAFSTKKTFAIPGSGEKEPAVKPGESDSSVGIRQQADKILLANYSPSSVVVDSRLQVLQFRGHTGPYLEHVQGAASLNVLQMARPSLAVDLRAAMHKALKQDVAVRKEGVILRRNGESREIQLDVIPFGIPGHDERWLLILFAERGAPHETGPSSTQRGKTGVGRIGEAERLRRELQATKESLQAIIEEQEATNEELKSANEEIESSNEELQSTNEELETAKEELQSTNEELTTLNDELSNRNIELAAVNNDLNNLLSSINLPIVMVDNALMVRRVTPLAQKLLNLIPADVGRRVTDVKPNIDLPDMERMIEEVIDTLSSREREVRDTAGKWHLLRIRPYRTAENKIDGAVITFVDIDDIKRTAASLEIAQYAEAIVETVKQPILVLDQGLRVEKANRAFYETFNASREATEKMFVYDLAEGRWNNRTLRTLLDKILPQNNFFEDFDIQCEIPGAGRRTMRLNGRRLGRENDEKRILLVFEDVTGRGAKGQWKSGEGADGAKGTRT